MIAWHNNNIFQMLSGMPAHLCYQLVNVGRDYLQARFLRWLSNKSLFKDPKTKKPRRLVLNSLDKLYVFLFGYLFLVYRITLTRISLSACSWFLVYPLYQHSTLQSLHLVPPVPLLPPLASFVPFSSLSPLVLPELATPIFSLATVTTIASQAVGSYFLFSFLQQSFCGIMQYYLFHRIRRILPRPDNPDSASISGALDEEDIDQSRWDSGAQPQINNRRPVVEEPSVAAIMIEETRRVGEDPSIPRFSATVQLDPQIPGIVSPHSGPTATTETDTQEMEIPAVDTQAQTNGSSPPHPHHHMPTAADPAAVTARMRSAGQQHRVTRLSLHPADVVASHAADGIATALSSGFESAVMRTVAKSFLVRQAGVDMSVVERTVYRPREIHGNLALVAKALAGEWALMWMLFEGSYYASTFIGLRWFGSV